MHLLSLQDNEKSDFLKEKMWGILRADYMRWAGSVCRDLGTSVKHTKNQLRDYMEKFPPG